jgi:hypothetical protein
MWLPRSWKRNGSLMGVTLSVQTVVVKRRFPAHEAKGRTGFHLSRIIRPDASLFVHLRDTTLKNGIITAFVSRFVSTCRDKWRCFEAKAHRVCLEHEWFDVGKARVLLRLTCFEENEFFDADKTCAIWSRACLQEHECLDRGEKFEAQFEAFHVVRFCSHSLVFIPIKFTSYVQYIYLSSITSYMFRCFLYHLQGDHCITWSETVCFWQCCYKMYNIPCF